MTANEILHQVAAKHAMTVDQIKSRNRCKAFVTARAEFIERAYTERQLSDGQIGKFINLTSWTVHYWRNHDARLRKNTRRYHERISSNASQ